MKITKIIIFLFLGIYSNVQSQVVDIQDKDGTRDTNAYYKDVNNLLNPFEGTYIYTNGNTSFKIILIKKVNQYNGRYYEDLIIGEYQYIENGVEKVNTLSDTSTIYNNQRLHNIDGNTIVDKNYRTWPCPNCVLNENRLSTSIRDASTNRYAKLIMRRTINNAQEVLQIKITYVLSVPYLDGEPEPAAFSLPIGEFTLIKQ
jgi:hypothetical protein